MKALGSSSEVMRNIEEHARSLRAGADASAKSSHVAGNALRKVLVDPFLQQLSGHGWYLVLGPRELREFMFTTFPEQAKGLRWLAEIRTANRREAEQLYEVGQYCARMERLYASVAQGVVGTFGSDQHPAVP